jgi:hypothetical protein
MAIKNINGQIYFAAGGSSAQLTLSTTGQLTAQNSSNGFTAFQVQNASSVNQLTVDTTDAKVYVGPNGGDTVGSILVLGNKTNTGDPATSAEGAIYYNNALKQFRCYREGNWGGCEIDQVDAGFNITDDFIGGTAATNGAIGSAGWTRQLFGSGTTVIDYNNGIAPTSDHPGIIRERANQASGSANSGVTLTLGNTSSGSVALGANYDVKTTAGVESATSGTQTLRIGLHNETASTATPTTGVWWEADPTANANWRYCYVNATPATVCATSGTAVAANTFARLEIHITALGTGTSTVVFTINGTASTVSGVTVNTTNLVWPAMTCYSQPTTEQDCDIDYYQVSGTASGLR